MVSSCFLGGGDRKLNGKAQTMKTMMMVLVLSSASALFAEDAQPAIPAAAAALPKDRPMLTEWLKHPEKTKKYDKNGDGKIDQDERMAAREDYRKEFGIVVKPGTPAAPGLQKPLGRGFDLWIEAPDNIKKYDQNGDGKIDQGERKAAREAWMREQGIADSGKK